MRDFLGIYFNATQWDIIPSKWLIKADRYCYWPNEGNSQTLGRARVRYSTTNIVHVDNQTDSCYVW